MKTKTLDDAKAGELWRLAQAEELIRCFRNYCGRSPHSNEELTIWVTTHRAEIPFDAEGKIVPSPEAIEVAERKPRS